MLDHTDATAVVLGTFQWSSRYARELPTRFSGFSGIRRSTVTPTNRSFHSLRSLDAVYSMPKQGAFFWSSPGIPVE
jgi:hypothetical protein